MYENQPQREQIIRSRAEREAAPLDEYRYPQESGKFTGLLRYRCWHRNKPMLLCYFDTDAGEKIKLAVWSQSWGVNYSPAETYINFADEVLNESRWRCVYRKKDNGFISWRRAELLRESPLCHEAML